MVVVKRRLGVDELRISGSIIFMKVRTRRSRGAHGFGHVPTGTRKLK